MLIDLLVVGRFEAEQAEMAAGALDDAQLRTLDHLQFAPAVGDAEEHVGIDRHDEGLRRNAPERLAQVAAGAEGDDAEMRIGRHGRTVLEEIDRIRDEAVTTGELETVKGNIIETFPRRFESSAGVLSTFVNDEWTDRPEGHWKTFRDRVDAVSPEDVQRVAAKHLHPDRCVVTAGGPVKASKLRSILRGAR